MISLPPPLRRGVFSHPKPSLSHPPPSCSAQSPRFRVIPPLFICAVSASQAASSAHSQPAVFFPRQHASILASTAGVSRQQAPDPALPGFPRRRELRGKSLRWCHTASDSAQVSRFKQSCRSEVKLLLLLLHFFILSRDSLGSHPSRTFCLRFDLSLFHPPVTPSLPPPASSAPLLSVQLSTSSLYFLPRHAPAHLSHPLPKKTQYATESCREQVARISDATGRGLVQCRRA